MRDQANVLLVMAGVADLVAAAAHLACIAGGASWYRFLGAGDRITRMAERGLALPHIYAAVIAAILLAWAFYCFSGAGLVVRLPLVRTALVAISAVYILRGLIGPFLLAAPGRSLTFLWISSAIVLAMGLAHAIGTAQSWRQLSID